VSVLILRARARRRRRAARPGLWLLVLAVAAGACRVHSANRARHYALGRAATPSEVAARDVDVGPDGEGLPAGHGTVVDGAALYAKQCAACHGVNGEGIPPYPRLVGRDPNAESFGFGRDPRLVRTIGNYWPYATTVFDYIRRAMPQNAPGSLSNDDVYAITAYLLAANQIIPMSASLDSASLVAVKMPAAGRFVRDDRKGGREVR
jgi:S-disulfanyl-L-cysteine oxidoreductase SoxD